MKPFLSMPLIMTFQMGEGRRAAAGINAYLSRK